MTETFSSSLSCGTSVSFEKFRKAECSGRKLCRNEIISVNGSVSRLMQSAPSKVPSSLRIRRVEEQTSFPPSISFVWK